MTDRFKQVVDSLNKYKPHLSGMGGSIRTAELGVFARNHIDILTEALYLAQEAEQLRKERDEYKHKYELTRAGCKNTDIKGNENGNA